MESKELNAPSQFIAFTANIKMKNWKFNYKRTKLFTIFPTMLSNFSKITIFYLFSQKVFKHKKFIGSNYKQINFRKI